jgi:ABC-type lipoprotein release transport system permease subunit
LKKARNHSPSGPPRRPEACEEITVAQPFIGIAVGLSGAILSGRLMEQFLVRTAPTDPVALGVVSVLLIVVATTASVWPARRAARVDPVVALRHD